MIAAWRICQRHLAKRAFDGEGAFLHGGRWNSPGTRVVYLASSIALAALEMLVHVEEGRDLLGERYVTIKVEFDPTLVAKPAKLPPRWGGDPAPAATARVGDRWVASGSSVILRVPSAAIPTESNYLLNPRHPDAARVRIGSPASFGFDPRLTRRK